MTHTYLTWPPALLHLDIRRADHLSPLLSFADDQFSEVPRRSAQRDRSEIGEARLHLGITQGLIDRGVEYFNDRRGSILWDTKPVPAARLITGQKLRDRWCVGKRVGPRRACDRKG